MILAESRRGRRILGRLDRGVELLEALTEVCRKRQVRCGEIRAIGALEAVELVDYDQREKQYRAARRFQAALEILNLNGNVSERAGELVVHAHVTVMRDRDNGIEVLGGHLVRARVFSCEFVIEAFDDVLLRRSFDEATGLELWSEKYEAGGAGAEMNAEAALGDGSQTPIGVEARTPSFELAVPSASEMPSASWADVARASQRAEVEEEVGEAFDVALIRTGDLLEHPRFGRCVVERIEGDHEFAAVRLETGRLVRLALDVLRFKLAREEDGRRVLQVKVQR